MVATDRKIILLNFTEFSGILLNFREFTSFWAKNTPKRPKNGPNRPFSRHFQVISSDLQLFSRLFRAIWTAYWTFPSLYEAFTQSLRTGHLGPHNGPLTGPTWDQYWPQMGQDNHQYWLGFGTILQSLQQDFGNKHLTQVGPKQSLLKMKSRPSDMMKKSHLIFLNGVKGI